MSDPPLPGEQSSTMAYALTVMDAYVSEQLDALVATLRAKGYEISQVDVN